MYVMDNAHDLDDTKLIELIKMIYKQRQNLMGYRRFHWDLMDDMEMDK